MEVAGIVFDEVDLLNRLGRLCDVKGVDQKTIGEARAVIEHLCEVVAATAPDPPVVPEEVADAMKHIAYEIPDDLHQRAKALSSYQGRTFKAWITRAIEAEVERQEAERAERALPSAFVTMGGILEALRAIIDAAEGRDLTDEEAERYEELEADLAAMRRSVEIGERWRSP